MPLVDPRSLSIRNSTELSSPLSTSVICDYLKTSFFIRDRCAPSTVPPAPIIATGTLWAWGISNVQNSDTSLNTSMTMAHHSNSQPAHPINSVSGKSRLDKPQLVIAIAKGVHIVVRKEPLALKDHQHGRLATAVRDTDWTRRSSPGRKFEIITSALSISFLICATYGELLRSAAKLSLFPFMI